MRSARRLAPDRTARLWCVVALLAACSPAAPAEPPLAPPEDLAGDGALPAPPTTGFAYHPPAVSPLNDAAPLADGRWLAVGQLGERWLSARLPQTAEDARGKTFDAQPSPYRAPHDLVSVAHLGDRGWMFLDAHGGVYTSLDPLGPLTVRGRATVPLVSLAASDGVVMASDALGQVFRWHQDNWSPVSTPAPLYALAGGGGIVGLSFPETLYASRDGRDFTPLGGDTFGAVAVEPIPGGRVAVLGARSAARFADGQLTPIAATPLTLPAPDVTLRAPRGPRASAIGQQLAVLEGDRYLEMVGAGDAPHLLQGVLGSLLKRTPVAFDACDDQVLAASGPHIVVVCGVQSKGAIDVVVQRSSDGGRRFRRVAALRSVTPAFAHAAVAPDGSVLLTGMCRRDAAGGSPGQSCEAGAPLRIGVDGAIVQTHATDLLSDAQAPAWSPDGKRAYFYGKRGKDQQRALFVSHDGGKTFDARALAKPAGHRGRWMTSQASRYITVDADGTLGLMLDDYPLTYATADADGRALTLAVLPEATQALGGHGRNLLALTQRNEPDRPALAELWESNDGGASFRPVSLPMELSIDEFTRLGVQCSAAGCIIGDRLTKLGWNPAIGPPAPPPADAIVPPELRTAIRCQAGGDWRVVDHVVAVRESYHLPAGSELMRGRTLWTMLRHDDRAGEVSVLSAELGPDGLKYKSHPLLAAVGAKRRAGFAYAVAVQADGFAAARVALPKAARVGAPMRDVEVAWIDFSRDARGRGVIDDAGPFGAEDVTPGERPSWLYGLLSMTADGLVLRPSDHRDDAFVLDRDGDVIAHADYPSWPPTRHEQLTLDAVSVGGSVIGVGDFRGEAGARTLALAPFGQSDARFVSMAPSGADRYIELIRAQWAGAPGVLVLLQDAAADHSQGWFSGFRADGSLGARVAVPTQADLPAIPPPCSDAQRRDTVRVPAFPNMATQHPVLIDGLGDERRMRTQRIILHGTPEAPCVAAWQAHSFGRDGSREAVISGDLSLGSVFEYPPDTPATVGMAPSAVRHRPLSCRFAPEVRVDPRMYAGDAP